MADESRSVVTPADLDALEARLTEVEAYLHIDEARGRVGELEQASAAPAAAIHGAAAMEMPATFQRWKYRARQMPWKSQMAMV